MLDTFYETPRVAVLLGILLAGAASENLQTMIASDGSVGDWFACSVSLSETTGLAGSPEDFVTGDLQGSAFVFRNLDTAIGTVVKSPNWSPPTGRWPTFWAMQSAYPARSAWSDNASNAKFGLSVSLDGDHLIVGAYENNFAIGKAYVGRAVR